MSAPRRRLVSALLAGAALLGAGVCGYLAARAAHGAPAAPRRVGRTIPEVASRPVRAPALAGARPEPVEPALPPPDAPSRSLRVRVETEESRPLPDVEVGVARAAAASDLDAGVVDGRDVLATGRTGADGEAWLVFPGSEPTATREAGRLAVFASPTAGRAGALETFADDRTEVRLRLARGLALGGLVVDALERPVAGLALEARHSGLGPPGERSADRLPIGARSVAAAVSDGAGRFLFEGLEEGAYDVWSAAPGWAAAYRTPLPRGRAGRTDLRITVHRVRAFRVRLTDGREPVRAIVRTASLLFEAPDALESCDVFDTSAFGASGWRRYRRETTEDGFLEGIAFLPAGDAAARSEARLLLQVDGHPAFGTRVTLREVGNPDEAEAADLVELPAGPAGRAAVVLDCRWEVAPGMEPGPRTRLFLAGPALGLNGVRRADGSWRFEGVPEGIHEDARASDGLGLSEPFSLRTGDERPIPVRFVRPRGLRVEARDPAGLRFLALDDVRVEGTTDRGDAFFARLPCAAPEDSGPGGSGRGCAHPVPAGTYEAAVRHEGYEAGRAEVTVPDAGVVTCRVTLRPVGAR